MERNQPFIITIEPPSGSSLATTMTDIRSWLDRRQIQTVLFRPISRYGIIGFQIGFRTEDEAELFRQEFRGVNATSENATSETVRRGDK